jgi:hypothetical protein
MRPAIRRLIATLVALALVAAFIAPSASAVQPGNAAFQRTWERTDLPVTELRAARTWVWGPGANTGVMQEQYADAPGGMRDVQYFDKSRMELTHKTATDNGLWSVTNGLLAEELISGRMQVGDTQFQDRAPSTINIAGDLDDQNGPTYATFNGLLTAPAVDNGERITARVARNGTVTADLSLATYGVTAAQHVQVPGIDHQIASPFWSYMNSSGIVYVDQQYVVEPLFQNPYYATGYPITEAYWATIKVNNHQQDVLTQCFERRCLTYTPGNPAGWQVEMGNIGRHYYAWRYGVVEQAPSAPTGVTLSISNPTDCTISNGVATECAYTLTLSWKDTSTNESGFTIATSFGTKTFAAATNATTWSQSFRLKPGKAVSASIVAWNKSGVSQVVTSNSVTPQPPAAAPVAAPSNVKLEISAPTDCTFSKGVATECAYTLTVTWKDESTNETGFEIRPSFANTTYKVDANVTTWSKAFRLEPREWITASVRSFNASTQSDWVTSTSSYLHEPGTPAAPSAVTLAVSNPSDCTVSGGVATECKYTLTVTWKDNAKDEAGFEILPNFTTTANKVGKDVTTWTGPYRLEPGEWISVSVRSYNGAGASDWVKSDSVYLTEPAIPSAPTQVNLTVSNPTNCTMAGAVATECAYTLSATWKDTATNEDGYAITVSYGSTVYQAPANATTWSRSLRLEPGKPITVSVAAWNEVGTSSAVVSNAVTPQPPTAVAPAAPTHVVLNVSQPYNCESKSLLGDCSWDVTLTWTDQANNETQFAIRQVPGGSVTTVGPNITTWKGTIRAHANTTLAFEVRAVNDAGASNWVRSNEVLLVRWSLT